MKKLIASAGLTALGAASLHAAHDGLLTPQAKSKVWTVGLAVNGFYDDNYNASPKDLREDSFGVEIRPSLGLNFDLDQTTIGLSYTYNLRWYEARPEHEIDQQHIVELGFDHSFSDRARLTLTDRFVYADEPDILDTGIITTPTLRRSDQSAYHNRVQAAFRYDFTEQFGMEVSYANAWYDYTEDGPGSMSALLNRLEHYPGANFRWYVAPPTTLLFGYQYQITDYTSSDSIVSLPGPFVDAETRNMRSHYLFGGVDHDFTSDFSVSLRLGAQITDYPDAPAGVDDDQVTPYVDASLNYVYNPGSFIKVGVRHTMNATDVAFVNSLVPVMNQESTAGYITWNHRITSRLTSTVTGLFQASEFNGGGPGVDGENEYLGLLGINLGYAINAFLSLNAGYNYDRLDSDLANRSYTRNRAYVGLSAQY